jgi:hypothetical protein
MVAEPPKAELSKRRSFQFSLGTLLLAVAVVAIILATLPLLMRSTAFYVGTHSNVYIDPDAGSKRAAIAADLTAIGAAVWIIRRKDKDGRKRRRLRKRAEKLRNKSYKLAAKQLRVQADLDKLLENLHSLKVSPIHERSESHQENESRMADSAPPRRRFQFRLMLVVLLMTLACVVARSVALRLEGDRLNDERHSQKFYGTKPDPETGTQ